MAKRFISFGKIQQFRNIVKNIREINDFKGLTEEDKAIYNHTDPYPIIKAVGSEKIHGTNASVCYSIPDGFWIQSRKNIITPESDNVGCAFWCEQNKDIWIEIIQKLASNYSIDLNKYIITVYFEWAGQGIQKNSACSGMEKRAIIFQHFKVSPIDPNEIKVSGDEIFSYWLETRDNINSWVDFPKHNIDNIMTFNKWYIEIDFNNPSESQNKMIKIIEEIELNSPYAKTYGIENNIGEGIVVTFNYNHVLHRFKVKGEKHSVSKVKTLKPVDEIKEQAKIDFANYACNAERLEQAWQNLFGINNEKQLPDITFMGNFIKSVMKDIIEEESDILFEKSLTPKDISKQVSFISKEWFNEELNNIIFKKGII